MYTFKKLITELTPYFGSDNIKFFDDGYTKKLLFGVVLDPNNICGVNNSRMYEIDNDYKFNFTKYNRLGREIGFRSTSGNTLTEIAEYIMSIIDTLVEESNNYIACDVRMKRTTDNDNEELIKYIRDSKENGKFQELYDLIKYKFFSNWKVGRAGIKITCNKNRVEDVYANFRYEMVYICKSYENNFHNGIDFVNHFGIDICELSNAIKDLMFTEVCYDNSGFKDYVFCLLKTEEEIYEMLKM